MQSLLAVLLVVRSRPGPQLVFCHPPNPQRASERSVAQNTESESDSDVDVDVNGIASLRRANQDGHKVKPSQDSSAPQPPVEKPAAEATTDCLFGFSEDSLERLLAPGVWCDRKRFQVGFDGVNFVGHPVHAYEDGRWTRRPPRTSRGAKGVSGGAVVDDMYGDYTNFGIPVTEPSSPVRTASRGEMLVSESLDTQLGQSLGTSMNSTSVTSSTETAMAAQIAMFNVVFVFDNSSKTDGREADAHSAYRHVIRKLSKALHYCQKASGYVSSEARRINALRAKARQDHIGGAVLQQQILEASELAWALKQVFESTSAGGVAGIRLQGQAITLGVPPTNASMDSVGQEESDLEPSAGLLLLEDKGSLLRELSHSDASPLAHFIREHTPTKSLSKLASRVGMSVDETMFLARHLTKWRKARPILPLHPRNTYVVHPDAPLERLTPFIDDYARQFPGLPSLPHVLKYLSSTDKPIRFGMLIPSRDHRAPYMEALAWFVRNGFVAQLKTYGWLRMVSPVRKEAARLERNISAERDGRLAPKNQNRVPLSVASLLSPQLKAVDDDDRVSVSSERTAIPLTAARNSHSPAQEPRASAGNGVPKEVDNEEPWDIILDPYDAQQTISDVQDVIGDNDLSERLHSLLHYFTGERALDEMAAREGVKRETAERWLELLVKEDLIATFRRL